MKTFKEMRQDPHRPSVMDPADYVFVGVADDHADDSYFEMNYGLLRQHGVETSETDPRSPEGVPWYDATQDGRPNYRCHHCGKHGSNIRYFCFFLHKPTKVVITVGQICAKKLNLGSREELEFQKRADAFRKAQERSEWAKRHEAEYDFLAEYTRQHEAGGRYVEFFESLWQGLQTYGSLTEKQLAALRKAMERQRQWEAEKVDADRHAAEVVHVEEPPTEAQYEYIASLLEWLQTASLLDRIEADAPFPKTRLEASLLINKLKAQKLKAAPQPVVEKATERQVSFINSLMEKRSIPVDKRREARQQLDAGLTKRQASAWIERLLELPEIES